MFIEISGGHLER